MPSKGGSRQQAVATGVAAMAGAPIASPSTAPGGVAFALGAGDLERPLRRGVEVDRFNELTRREELTPEESDELYGYRMRRLQSRLRRLD
jgi:hypothetical protein